MSKPTEQAVKAAKEIMGKWGVGHEDAVNRTAEIIDRETNLPEIVRVSQMALSYLADLNGSEWFACPNAIAVQDMKQRAEAIQQMLFETLQQRREK